MLMDLVRKKKLNNKGVHVLADIYTVSVTSKDLFDAIAIKALEKSGMSFVGHASHTFGNDDSFTSVYLLAESHFSVHAYPERNYLSVDCYTCGDTAKPMTCIAAVVEALETVAVAVKHINRGA